MRLRSVFVALLLLPAAPADAATVSSQEAAIAIAKTTCAEVPKKFPFRAYRNWVALLDHGVWLVDGVPDIHYKGTLDYLGGAELLEIRIPADGSAPSACRISPDGLYFSQRPQRR